MSKKGEKYPAEPLSSGEVRALLNGCSPRCPTGLRNRALLVVLWRAGLRISEALDLESRDLDGEVVRVRNGKGGRSRTVGMDPEAWAVLQTWMLTRDKLKISGSKVFCTLKGQPMKTAYVRTLLPRLARKAGIAKRVHPHGLRHTYAFGLASEGFDLRDIQVALGHSSLGTTGTYISHLNPVDLLKQLASRQW